MEFKLIELSTWKRKEHFDHYFNQVTCLYSMTVNVDLTYLIKEIKRTECKLYPTMLYLLALIVNKHEEFRTSIDTKGNIGIFDFLHPSYTILHKDSEIFTNVWTEHSFLFSEFYERYLLDIKKFGKSKSFIAKPNVPTNIFHVSAIPWVSFTGFNLHLPKNTDYLLPIFTTGKYFEQNGKIVLPLAIQVHHAVCDGFHIAKFIHELQEAMNTLKIS